MRRDKYFKLIYKSNFQLKDLADGFPKKLSFETKHTNKILLSISQKIINKGKNVFFNWNINNQIFFFF